MKRYRLIKARKAAGLSTEQLSQHIEVSKSMITFLENCRCNPSWSVAQRLEKFFGIPASELLAESKEQQLLAK